MKAYIVGLNSDPDIGNEIVFASNSKEARKEAMLTQIAEEKESYIDVYVKRYSELDNFENLSDKELMLQKFRCGWWFFDGGLGYEEDTTDEQFYKWYDETFCC